MPHPAPRQGTRWIRRHRRGFSYRIVHIEPSLIQRALRGKPLPFVAQPVVDAARLPKGCAREIWNIDDRLDDIARVDLVVTIVGLLHSLATASKPAPSLALDRVSRVRDLIAACPAARHSMDELERVCGLDRWTLARQFRIAFGTSPTRFRTLRQLDAARSAITRGQGLVDAALHAGFADQSHMTRQFKRAYGLTPAQWAASLVSPESVRASMA